MIPICTTPTMPTSASPARRCPPLQGLPVLATLVTFLAAPANAMADWGEVHYDGLAFTLIDLDPNDGHDPVMSVSFDMLEYTALIGHDADPTWTGGNGFDLTETLVLTGIDGAVELGATFANLSATALADLGHWGTRMGTGRVMSVNLSPATRLEIAAHASGYLESSGRYQTSALAFDLTAMGSPFDMAGRTVMVDHGEVIDLSYRGFPEQSSELRESGTSFDRIVELSIDSPFDRSLDMSVYVTSGIVFDDLVASPVPEPLPWQFLGSGLAAFAVCARRRSS